MEIAGYCGHAAAAIVLYKKVWEDPLGLIERLEAGLGATEDTTYNWQPALVVDLESMPEYRDCSDFKIAELTKSSEGQIYKLRNKFSIFPNGSVS